MILIDTKICNYFHIRELLCSKIANTKKSYLVFTEELSLLYEERRQELLQFIAQEQGGWDTNDNRRNRCACFHIREA